MDLSAVPFQLAFTFDEVLREVPISIDKMINGIEYLKKQGTKLEHNDEELAKIYRWIGVYSRVIHRLDESKKYLLLAIEINERLENKRSLFVNQLRLAHVYQWERNACYSRLQREG